MTGDPAQPSDPAPDPSAFVPRQRFRGSFDFAARDRIAGWAFNPSTPEERVAVEILANGKIIARIVADAYRGDLESAGIGDGRHSFEYFPEPGLLAPDMEHEIAVRRQSDGAPLTRSPRTIDIARESGAGRMAAASDSAGTRGRAPAPGGAQGDDEILLRILDEANWTPKPRLDGAASGEPNGLNTAPQGGGAGAAMSSGAANEAPSEVGAQPAAAPPLPEDPVRSVKVLGLGRLNGSLDVVARGSVSGWAQNETEPHLPVGLVVSADGKLLMRVLANRFRGDLRKAGIGDGNHGFEIMFPELSPLEPHELHVMREVDGVELPGSPKIIPAATAFDADVEKGIAVILSAIDRQSEARALEFLARQADQLIARRAHRESGRAARHLQYLFRRRWGRLAADEGAAEPRPGPVRPRALVIDDYVPDAGRDAGSVAIISHMTALQAIGFEVAFVAARDLDNEGAMAALEATRGVSACGMPFYYSVEDVLKRQAETFEAVYLHRLSNAKKYMSLVRTYQPKARVVYSVADLHHVRLARQSEVEQLASLRRVSEQFAFEELTAARQADAVITHSPQESAILGRAAPPSKVHVVPWAVAPRPVTAPFAERLGLAVIGNFSHNPNPDSVFWLLRQVMPLVWTREPSMRCLIVGHGWSEERLPRRDARAELIGPVPDLKDIFDRVRLTVAPLRFGAGIKGKVLESLAAGIPCVMSPIAAEGLTLPAVLTEYVASTAQSMAEAIIRLHWDGAANRAAGQAGLELIARDYSEQRVIEAMARVLPLSQSEKAVSASPG